MPRPLRDSRIGVYECNIVDRSIIKGSYICGDYIGVFTWDYLISAVIPDLRQKKTARWPFQYPVLIASWRLQQGDPAKPLPIPVSHGKLNISRVGLAKAKRMVGLPVRRKKNPRTETWEAVVDESGCAIRVVGRRLADR